MKEDGSAARLRFFHRADDPWSHLLLQVMPRLLRAYDVELTCITVPFPDIEHAPRPEMLARHALRDARDLAAHCDVEFETDGHLPAQPAVALASRALLALETTGDYLAVGARIGTALFRGDTDGVASLCGPLDLPSEPTAAARLRDNHAALLAAGHYLSGMIEYRGNWYWGVDRLSHLEHDLLMAGRRRAGASVGLLRRRRRAVIPPSRSPRADGGTLVVDWFCSFRSPYAYVAAERTFDLARRYPVHIRPRLILPMKMAGFVIPPRKSAYFRIDPAREALRHGVRFGNFCDPYGRGLERAMAAAKVAERAGRLEPFILSVMAGVWADGIDTASDDGLRMLVERAGLEWSEVVPVLSDDSWRNEADRNRKELARLGQYAAPTYRLGDWVTWGQDRIWMLEERIREALGEAGGFVEARAIAG